MTESSGSGGVLDASALLALVYDESGADRVEPALRRGALITAVNWAEALSRMAELGDPVDVSVPRVRTRIARIGPLLIVPFDDMDKIVRKSSRVGLVVPMQNDQFKVARFSLAGSSKAIERMLAAASERLTDDQLKNASNPPAEEHL